MGRILAFTILLLLSIRFTACSSDYGQVREFYQDRGISHCLAGNCMDGDGKVSIDENLVYEGHFQDYVPNGNGSLYEGERLVYSGNWEYGNPANGQAVVSFASGDDGTQGPVSGNLGPKVKDYGDQGAMNIIGGILMCASGRSAGPRRLP